MMIRSLVPSVVPPDAQSPDIATEQQAATAVAVMRQLFASMPRELAITLLAPAVEMTLADFVEQRYLVEHDLRGATADYYRMKVGIYSRWLGRTAMLADLNDDAVNRFLIHRAETKSRETVRGDKSTLVSWWNSAVQCGTLALPPRRLRKLKRSAIIPQGWTPEELQQMLTAARNCRGLFRGKGVSRAAFWRAFVLTAYDTGLRLSDLLQLETSLVKGPGAFDVIQQKTQRPVETGISLKTWQAIAATNPANRRYIFGFISRHSFFPAFRKFRAAAGVKGGTKFLRRTSGSMVESIAPGQGYKHLGHSDTGETFNRHYHVRAFTRRDPILPPEIPDLPPEIPEIVPERPRYGSTQYRGVQRKGNIFTASIRLGRKFKKHLGCFKSDVEAAKAYDAAAREVGRLALLNFPGDAATPATAKQEGGAQ